LGAAIIVMPAKAGIQYSETSKNERDHGAYWIIRFRG
jgi:hypothetical protein